MFASADTILEYFRFATLDSDPRSGAACFSVMVSLARNLATGLVKDIIDHTSGIQLDFLLETRRQLGSDADRSYQEACKVAEATLKTLEVFQSMSDSLTDGMTKARAVPTEIIDDQVAQKAAKLGTHPPTPFFLQVSNPALCSVQAFTVLYQLQRGARKLEQRMPYTRNAITLYKMMHRLLPITVCQYLLWSDAEYAL